MSFLRNGTASPSSFKGPAIGRRGVKTGPGRGRTGREAVEDEPPRLMNPAVHKAQMNADRAVEEHPMSVRLESRRLRHLRAQYRSTVGPEFNKVMNSTHPGKHRAGKVKGL